jgi:integrase
MTGQNKPKRKRRGNQEGSIVQRPDGRWASVITLARNPNTGKLRRRWMYGKTRQEVVAKLAHAQSDRARGAFVEPHRMTIGQWLNTWLSDYARPKVRQTTFDNYDGLVRRHLVPVLGRLPLQSLRADHIQGAYNAMHAAGLSPGTIGMVHMVLSAALRQAVRVGLVTRNACEAVTLPRRLPREIHPLTLDEVRRFLAAIKQDRLYPAMFLEFGTGLRRGELLATRWADLDLDAGVLHVRQALSRVRNRGTTHAHKTHLQFHEPKTESSRRSIPIPADISVELRAHKARQAQERLLFGQAYQDHGLVFAEPDGRPIDPRTFTRRFDRLLQQAGLPHSNFHSARHAYATIALELGESAKVVQSNLGHAKIATTLDTYSHVSLDLQRQAAARMNEALRG